MWESSSFPMKEIPHCAQTDNYFRHLSEIRMVAAQAFECKGAIHGRLLKA